MLTVRVSREKGTRALPVLITYGVFTERRPTLHESWRGARLDCLHRACKEQFHKLNLRVFICTMR